MYFVLDENDSIYDVNGEVLYRIIATEDFRTVNPAAKGMLSSVMKIHKGEKGGYAGSRFSLEERLGCGIKPWVFPSASISLGSILSGMSAIADGTEVYNDSIIEGGCILKNTLVDNSRISAVKCAEFNDDILASFNSEGNCTEKNAIINSLIRCDNVKIFLSLVSDTEIEGSYGNVRIFNSSLANVRASRNFEITDTVIRSGSGYIEIPPNTVYHKGGVSPDMPSFTMKRNGRACTHEECWKDMSGAGKETRGVYKNVVYSPLCRS